jgi:hypothetical protein
MSIDEYFSASQQMQTIRSHDNSSHTVQILDMQNNTMYRVVQNTSGERPVGICTVTHCGNTTCPGQVRGLATVYLPSAQQIYDGPGHKVRNIMCYRWSRNFSNHASNFSAFYHFQQDNWKSTTETYSTLLKRIMVNGTTAAGRAFSNSYEIVDVRYACHAALFRRSAAHSPRSWCRPCQTFTYLTRARPSTWAAWACLSAAPSSAVAAMLTPRRPPPPRALHLRSSP